MRRIIGPTGAPQVVPAISAGLAPLLDFTSQQAQQLLNGRTIYVNLWAYFAFDDTSKASYDADAFPAFWQGMQNETPSGILNACLFASDSANLQTAVASSKHRIVNDLVAIPHQTQILKMPLDGILDAIGPTRVLTDYPIAGGTALWLIHNYASLIQGDRQMYVWGYYRFEGDPETPGPVRPLRPDITSEEPNVPYFPPNCASDGNAVDVHEVDSTYQDEVTLDVKFVGYDGQAPNVDEFDANFNGYLQPPSGGVYAAATTFLRFTNSGNVAPVQMPIWSGAEEDAASIPQSTRKVQWWKNWLDGIPMRGAGKIQLLRTTHAAFTTRACAKGTFVRY